MSVVAKETEKKEPPQVSKSSNMDGVMIYMGEERCQNMIAT
jgi:hypothetical protein